MLYQRALASSHYTLLGVHPSASMREIRQAYRDLSKLYHPDTTALPAAIATDKFQKLNEAYATLSNPERRTAYDNKIGYSRVAVVQPLPHLNQPTSSRQYVSSAYLDPTDRPLSPGEIFALFILGLTFVACLVLAITIGITRGEAVFQPITAQAGIVHQAPTSDPKISPDRAAAPDHQVTATISSEAIQHDLLTTESTVNSDDASDTGTSSNIPPIQDLSNSSKDLHDTPFR